MYVIQTTNKFEKDTKRLVKRDYQISLLKETINTLEKVGSLPAKYKAHKLVGNYNEHWECHIKNDWLRWSTGYGHDWIFVMSAITNGMKWKKLKKPPQYLVAHWGGGENKGDY